MTTVVASVRHLRFAEYINDEDWTEILETIENADGNNETNKTSE